MRGDRMVRNEPHFSSFMQELRSPLKAVSILLLGLSSPAPSFAQDQELIRQSQEEADRKSQGCVTCHGGIESMHVSQAVKLGCIDCHLGNADATTIEEAHVRARFPESWKTSANPVRSYTLLNIEDPAFIRFVNPGDLRVADEACGLCHNQEVLNVKKSLMTTSTLMWGGAAYNNGIVSNKTYMFGESYSNEGAGQRVNTVPAPTKEELKKGVLPFIVPLPRWEIAQVTDNFRTFERGGKVSRINPSEIAIPNPFEEPGRPDMKLGARGVGTELRVSSPLLNLQKTRLNDPHLSFLGTNDHPGDYRSSGCTACHVVYANDRSIIHSGPYAKYGNRGLTQTADTTISRKQPGHPIKHQFTRSIPSSQCMVCHMHQPNAFVNTFFGYQMWDYETDGELLYPKQQEYPSATEAFQILSANPEEAALRGKWHDEKFLANVVDLNPQLQHTQFADYHGHGWVFRGVFKKDRKGNLLDKDGKIIPWDSPHKFEGVTPLASSTSSGGTKIALRDAQKAVHLKDIHAEKGMHCVDCHFKQDVHGNGKLYGEFHNAIEIQCIDCHGTVTQRATLRTSGLAAQEKGTAMDDLYTPFGERRFRKRADRIFQRSMVVDTLEWEISQVVETINPNSKQFNPRSRAAKLVARGGKQWSQGMDPSLLAHSNDKMECYSCHTSWVTNCFGCHLPQQANWKKTMNHFEGEAPKRAKSAMGGYEVEPSRNWTSYNPQVIREDGYMLCINGTTKGNKVAPARSSSALVLSSVNANREQVYLQQPPISAPGYSSQAFNPHFAHTVRKTETKTCTDCHLSTANDNNAWMAQLLLHGTNMVNFMGKYVYVATGEDGFEAVAVTETEEPQAVIGSYLHKLAYPDYYNAHLANTKELKVSHHHGGSDVRSVQLRGEYLYTANGPDGFRVFDVANVDNKGFSERIVTAPVSQLGQDTHVDTRYATAVALPTNMPIDTRRVHRPENQEQWPIHPSYSYAYITDKYEGLILVDVMPLVDGDPGNNFLDRALTYNPEGKLNGAVNLAVAGNYVYVCCDAGLLVVNVQNPLKPRIAAEIRRPAISKAKAVAIQFRYAFVVDEEGVKVIDITHKENPKLVEKSIRLQGANDIYVTRTFAYVAAGSQGLAIIDIENPENIVLEKLFSAAGVINDAQSVKVASTNASVFAYVADGKNGLRVIQLTSPEDTPGYQGFSPKPNPKLIATRVTGGRAVAVSKGLDRDRAVDESGNQVSVFGRMGSRPFTLEEQQRLYMREGKIWTVTDEGVIK